MNRLELGVTLAGALLMVVAASAVDWRLGLFLAGLLLTVTAFDLPRTRA